MKIRNFNTMSLLVIHCSSQEHARQVKQQAAVGSSGKDHQMLLSLHSSVLRQLLKPRKGSGSHLVWVFTKRKKQHGTRFWALESSTNMIFSSILESECRGHRGICWGDDYRETFKAVISLSCVFCLQTLKALRSRAMFCQVLFGKSVPNEVFCDIYNIRNTSPLPPPAYSTHVPAYTAGNPR